MVGGTLEAEYDSLIEMVVREVDHGLNDFELARDIHESVGLMGVRLATSDADEIVVQLRGALFSNGDGAGACDAPPGGPRRGP